MKLAKVKEPMWKCNAVSPSRPSQSYPRKPPSLCSPTDRQTDRQVEKMAKTGSTSRSVRPLVLLGASSKPWRSHYRRCPSTGDVTPLSAPEKTSNREANVPSTRLCKTLFPSPRPCISPDFVTASQEAVITRHCAASLYLQQDHQQPLVVPGGVAADVLLQLAAELWRGEKNRLMTLVGSS